MKRHIHKSKSDYTNYTWLDLTNMEEGVIVDALKEAYATSDSEGRCEVIKGLLDDLGVEVEE